MSDAADCLPAFTLSVLAAVPEVKVSEQTPSDELARKMRHHSGRSEYMWGIYRDGRLL